MADAGSGESPVVSVVIPARNAAARLGRCLESLHGHAVSLELIVVDQRSTDDTREIAARWGAEVIDVEPTSVYTPPTRSRNLGAAHARGTYLMHLDADMSLARPWLEAAVELCESARVALVLEEVDVASGFWARCKALERHSYRNSPLEAARFVRASVFRAVGGYDETLGSGEDWDIHARYMRQGSVGRVSNALHHHLDATTFRRQLRRKFDYGRSLPAFVATHETRPLGGAMVMAYARSWRSFAADPAHAFGFAVLRVGEAAAMTSGAVYERASSWRSRPR